MKTCKNFVTALCLTLIVSYTSSAFARTSPTNEIAQEVTLILAIATNQELNPIERRSQIRQVLEGRFDINDMSQRILAVNWSNISNHQKSEFIRLFKDILELTYLTAIESYSSERVNIGGERIKGDKATIIVTITRIDGTEIPLLFKMKWQNNKWLAYDANINYLSMVNNYRKQYSEIIKNKGMDGLLQHIQSELAEAAPLKP